MQQNPPTTIEEYSESYWILPEIRVEPARVDNAAVNVDVLVELGRVAGSPLMKLGNEYHWLSYESSIPSDFLAVPLDGEIERGTPALMAKRAAATEMVEGGIVEPPEG